MSPATTLVIERENKGKREKDFVPAVFLLVNLFKVEI